MAASDQRAKSSKMAADLVKRGYYHGRRFSTPHKNSGGTTMTMNVPGSSKNHRRLTK